MDYYLSSSNTVATRLFRPEHKLKVPTHRQLDPRSDRYRHHTRHLATPRSVVNLSLRQPEDSASAARCESSVNDSDT